MSRVITAGRIDYDDHSRIHQQDWVMSAEGICRCIAVGCHGSSPHLLKVIVEDTRQCRAIRNKTDGEKEDNSTAEPYAGRHGKDNQGELPQGQFGQLRSRGGTFAQTGVIEEDVQENSNGNS